MAEPPRRSSLADGRKIVFETSAGVAEDVGGRGKPGRQEDAIVTVTEHSLVITKADGKPTTLHLRSLSHLHSPTPTLLILRTVSGTAYHLATSQVDEIVAHIRGRLAGDFPGMFGADGEGGSLEVSGIGPERLALLHTLYPDLSRRDPGPGGGIVRSYESMCEYCQLPPTPPTLHLLHHQTRSSPDALRPPVLNLADHPDAALPLALAVAYNGWFAGLEVEGPTGREVAEAVGGWAEGGGVAESLSLHSTSLPPLFHASLFGSLASNPDLVIRRTRLLNETLDERAVGSVAVWLQTHPAGVVEVEIEAEGGKRGLSPLLPAIASSPPHRAFLRSVRLRHPSFLVVPPPSDAATASLASLLAVPWPVLRVLELRGVGLWLDTVGEALAGATGGLEVVRFSGNGWRKKGGEAGWTSFVSCASRLRTLDLSSTGIPTSYLAAVLEGLQRRQAPAMEVELDLEANRMDAEHAELLRAHIPRLPPLRLLRLSRNDFGSDASLLPILLALRSARGITRIDLAECLTSQPPEGRQIRVVIREMAGVITEGRSEVSVGGNRLGLGEVAVLFAALSSSSTLRRLDLSGLDLSSDSASAALGVLVRTAHKLSELILEGTGIGLSGWCNLARAIEERTSLVSLPLPHGDIASLHHAIAKSAGPAAAPLLRRLSQALSTVDESIARNRSKNPAPTSVFPSSAEPDIAFGLAIARKADAARNSGAPPADVDVFIQRANKVWERGTSLVAKGTPRLEQGATLHGAILGWLQTSLDSLRQTGLVTVVPDVDKLQAATAEVLVPSAKNFADLDLKQVLEWAWARVTLLVMEKPLRDLTSVIKPRQSAAEGLLPGQMTHVAPTREGDHASPSGLAERPSPPPVAPRPTAEHSPDHGNGMSGSHGKLVDEDEDAGGKKKKGLKSFVGTIFGGKKKSGKNDSQSVGPSNENISNLPELQHKSTSPDASPPRIAPDAPPRKSVTIVDATRAHDPEAFTSERPSIEHHASPPPLAERPPVPSRAPVTERSPSSRSNPRASVSLSERPLSAMDADGGESVRASSDFGASGAEGIATLSRTSLELVSDGESTPSRSRKVLPSMAMSALAGVMMQGAIKRNSLELAAAPPPHLASEEMPTSPARSSISLSRDFVAPQPESPHRGSQPQLPSSPPLGPAPTPPARASPPVAPPRTAATHVASDAPQVPMSSSDRNSVVSGFGEEMAALLEDASSASHSLSTTAPLVATLPQRQSVVAASDDHVDAQTDSAHEEATAPVVLPKKKMPVGAINIFGFAPPMPGAGRPRPPPRATSHDEDLEGSEEQTISPPQDDDEDPAERAQREKAERAREEMVQRAMRGSAENLRRPAPPPIVPRREQRDIAVPEKPDARPSEASPAPRHPPVPPKPKVPPKPPARATPSAESSEHSTLAPRSSDASEAPDVHESVSSPVSSPIQEEAPRLDDARPKAVLARRPTAPSNPGGSAFSGSDDRAVEKNAIEWLNIHQTIVEVTAGDLHGSLKDGIVLINALEHASGESAGKYNKRAMLPAHKFDNLQVAINFMGKLGVHLGGRVQPMDIINEDKQKILVLFVAILKRFPLS
ncbi:hypothetical protein M427DRAFT_68863 [Gonapodya prolifera JEL478]|uniref:Calponin-homology (CH) domain-containing protein n=1 Tax=Gonapodya prolifera (strain JEL478) TaxID=1344416 RepID=A0A139AK13_GONPJ|nr:hypothetical protein M427DRAFT_68863 [Gonapodya prolifera JEL478]|eukprot:KXS16843.1 hypothetical protein M427DRAFT_68863 [Gonapodya prolifera JEL478]